MHSPPTNTSSKWSIFPRSDSEHDQHPMRSPMSHPYPKRLARNKTNQILRTFRDSRVPFRASTTSSNSIPDPSASIPSRAINKSSGGVTLLLVSWCDAGINNDQQHEHEPSGGGDVYFWPAPSRQSQARDRFCVSVGSRSLTRVMSARASNRPGLPDNSIDRKLLSRNACDDPLTWHLPGHVAGIDSKSG